MSVTRGHVPQRRCRVCRSAAAKPELARWTIVEGQLMADSDQRAPGRGLYTCSEACAARLPKMSKSFKR